MSRDPIEAFAPSTRSKPAVWLDFFAYARRVLLRGTEIPWLQPAEFLHFYRRAQALLQSDVAYLPVGRVYDAWLAATPAALSTIAGRKRVSGTLRQLLTLAEPRHLAIEALRGMREGYGALPLILSIPSPAAWAASAHTAANSVRPQALSEVDVESAAMYVADFLRNFAKSFVDGLLLEDGGTEARVEPGGTDEPVRNVARHYRWSLGRFTRSSACRKLTLTSADGAATCTGIVVSPAFWDGADPPLLPERGFYYADVPENAVPEAVLERLAALR